MRVAEVSAFGGPEVLRLAEWPDPVAGEGEAVVRVRAANVNPTDLGARTGRGPRTLPDPPFVLGWDFAGEVMSVGAGVTGLAPGDRVVGMIHWYSQADGPGRQGAYAQQVAVPADTLVPLPDAIDWVTAATLPLNGLTAVQGLELLALPVSTRMLVTGASGAVGAFAAQLAVQAGHRVLAQASHDDEAWVGGLGVAEVVPREADLSRLEKVAAVFDAVPLGAPALAAVEDGGAVVSTRAAPETPAERRVRQEMFLVRQDPDALAALVAAVVDGRMHSRIDRVLTLAEAAEAHRLNEAGGLRGKVVLTP